MPGLLSITNSWSLLKLKSMQSVMPSSHLILCCPLLFLLPIPPSIRVFSNESALRIRWPKVWSFSFSISPFRDTHNNIFGLFCTNKPQWIEDVNYLKRSPSQREGNIETHRSPSGDNPRPGGPPTPQSSSATHPLNHCYKTPLQVPLGWDT